jgi:alpha-D-xyloside xylohydrolase
MPPATPIVLDSSSGTYQARIFPDTGRIALAGPDLSGTPLAAVTMLEPIEVTLPTGATVLGRVDGAPRIAGGTLEVELNMGGAKATARFAFPADGVLRVEVISWGGPTPTSATISAMSDASEHFFGLGERFNALDQTGRRVEVKTNDHPGPKFDAHDRTKPDFAYKVVPWFLSSRGYGFHLDSSVESVFDLRQTHPDRFVVLQPFIPDRPGGLAIHLVAGPRLTDALRRYTALAGRPPLPPPWAFGPWISSDAWRNGGEVRYVVEKFLQRKIPVSAFVFDSPWETAYNDFTFNLKDGSAPDPSAQFGKGGTFEDQPGHPTQDFAGFKTLAEMMRFLQTSGLKVVCWMAPFTNDESSHDEKAGEANDVIVGQKPRADNFNTGTAEGVFVRGETDGTKAQNGSPRPGIHWWKGHGSHIDFTNPAARAWLKGQLVKLIDACRVPTRSGAAEPALCGFKTDDGEAQTAPKANNNPTGVYLSTDAKYSDPSVTAAEMRNHYSVVYHEAIHTILTDAIGPGKGLLFSRGGFHGSQAFPGCWAGDNIAKFDPTNGLPSVVTAGLSAALSGFSIWGHDVGGYQKVYEPPPTDIDLFIRWTQFGCFSPIMQMHRQLSDGPPNVSHPHGQYPWGYVSAAERADPANHGREFVNNEALRNYRFYAELHTRLFPYLYTFAKESSETGLPILRPLVLMHQDDPTTFGIDHTYYFGSELLVAPIIEPNTTSRTVYLPRGVWLDFWTNERIDHSAAGSDHAWSNADRSKLPVFARDGAIVPMFLELPQTLCDADYVNNDAIQTAGDGLLVRIYPADSSHFVVHDGTEITCRKVAGAIEIGVTSPKARPVRLSVRAETPPAGVTRDGTIVDERDDVDAFDSQSSAWRHDAVTGVLEIKFSLSAGSTTVRVSLI